MSATAHGYLNGLSAVKCAALCSTSIQSSTSIPSLFLRNCNQKHESVKVKPCFSGSTIMQSWLSSCLLVLSLEPAATQCMRDTNTRIQKVCQGHLDCADFPVEKALPLWSDKQIRKLRAYAALNPVGRCAWFTTHHPCKVKPEEPKFLVLPYFCSTRLEFQEIAKQWKTCFLKPLSCSISLVSH